MKKLGTAVQHIINAFGPSLLIATTFFVGAAACFAQGEIHSGESPTGAISPVGDVDTWTFAASAGDRVIVSLGELSDDSGGFEPRIRIIGPNGMQVTDDYGSTTARVYFDASENGTYMILVDDAYVQRTGTYQLFLFRSRAAFTVPSGDQGGTLTNGANHQGDIRLGDIDIWSFTGRAGDSVLLSIGQLSDDGIGSGFYPQIILYRPDGTQATYDYGSIAARFGIQLSQTGTYLVVVNDAYENGSGSYLLRFAKAPGDFVVPAGDEGGPLVSTGHRTGIINLGDLDMWSFVAYEGSSITLNIGELTDDGGFYPEIALYRPDGTLYDYDYGSTGAQIVINNADEAGTYTLVVFDAYTSSSGSYNLSYTRSFDPPHADFNGDAKPDWVLQKPSTRQVANWLMNDGSLLASSYGPSLPAGWTILDAEQFGGGANSADYLLYNPTTRDTVIWYMNGSIRIGAAVAPKPPGGWANVLSQDFNGDANPDLLLYQRSTGKTVVWYLSGARYVGALNGPTLPSGWIVVGAADFNRDERADLLIYQISTHKTAIWYLNGAKLIGGTYGPTLPSGWTIACVDDFNRDGKPDLALSNAATHQSAVWHLANNSLLSTRYGPGIPPGWVLSAPK